MDENYQAGREGLEYAASKGLGISIMEPLRGGLLARKNDDIESIFSKADTIMTPVEWALRFVWNHPEVSIVLSGMNDESQIEENVNIANRAQANSLSNNDLKYIVDAK